MIPLNEAIDNGLWLKAAFVADEHYEKEAADEPTFQIKLLNLAKINLAKEVDEPLKLTTVEIDSNIWLLKVEVVNLCKKAMVSSVIRQRVILIDNDKFQFSTIEDDHLILGSDYAMSSGLSKFYFSYLPPKVKRRAVLAFELPDHFDELYISIRDGSLMEA